MDRTADLHPEDADVYQLASLELRATGIDEALAEMSPALVRHGVAEILRRHGNTAAARAVALAWLDLARDSRGGQAGFGGYRGDYGLGAASEGQVDEDGSGDGEHDAGGDPSDGPPRGG